MIRATLGLLLCGLFGASCVNRAPGTCSSGFGDCNLQANDGCETELPSAVARE